jgi:hypothetical protein
MKIEIRALVLSIALSVNAAGATAPSDSGTVVSAPACPPVRGDDTLQASPGDAIISEHKGTHMMPVKPGATTISGLDYIWIVGEEWTNLTAAVNHWTPGKSRDLECADGLCERDDRIIVEVR